jgi:hypothetical protein
MNELTPQTLLVLVPLLPLVGAVLTVALGRLLGRHAHLPAVAAIAAAFVVAGMLLTGIVKEVGDHAGHGTPAHAVEMTTTLWQWTRPLPARRDPAAGRFRCRSRCGSTRSRPACS